MQSVSPRSGVALWARTRAAAPAATVWSAILVFGLVLTIARSTVSALWVPAGIDGIPFVALGAAVMMSLLAVSPVPAWLSVMLGTVAGPLVSVLAMSSQFKLAHPDYPSGFGAIQFWLIAMSNGSALGDQVFIGLVITLLMWITGAWLAWCVVRWRQPLIGLIPGAAAFATNVLNTNNQQGYTFIFLALTLGLLLWTTYTDSVAKAIAARIKLSGDARWDFWQTGLIVTAGLLVVGILLPPISTIDRTQTMETSVFQHWANLQSQLNRITTPRGGSPGGVSTTGFSEVVQMNKSLKVSQTPVFTYALTAGPYPGPDYFRGVNLAVTELDPKGVPTWAFGGTDYTTGIAAESVPTFAENYKWNALATFAVAMINPPSGNYFYPGQFYGIDKAAVAHEAVVPPLGMFAAQLATVDRLTATGPTFSTKGVYLVLVGYPDVSADELRADRTDYGDWLKPYTILPATGYRPAYAINYIHDLALQLTAGLTNTYDKASAIESYLRSANFKYTYTPPQAPKGVDPMYFFLHDSHQGYCQYFAMAMGEMMRSLDIPTRLVSGYGPGGVDSATRRQIVRDADSHVWVESYFPTYGWIPFEPTNDGFYQTITRPSSRVGACFTDNHCNNPSPVPALTSPPPRTTPRINDPGAAGDIGAKPTGTPLGFLDANLVIRLLGLVGALLLFVVGLGFRYLRPRTVMGVWRRVLTLARIAGAELSPGETPFEVDQRLSTAFPEAAPHLHSLTGSFVVAAYAPPEVAATTRASVMEAWASLRPVMVRRALSRLRPGR